ncbi:RCC1/BLIP-II [Rickenella mellea]|uniref:RCC1/BLIP-II n=1 Tax=Rickenella mellea TaxID=50990 RepID=A0A4Y7QHU4_9AGAM|nr:RCC1/BLIP-II [Rickenella mellea]
MKTLRIVSAGSNAKGQLAQNSVADAHTFNACLFSDSSALSGTAAVTSIATGSNHSLITLRDTLGQTRLWGCGDGSRGQLGEAYGRQYGCSSVLRPIDLSHYHDRDVSMIAAAWETSYITLTHPSKSDIVLSLGANDFGDLGIGAKQKGSVTSGQILFDHLFSSKSATDIMRVLEIKAGPHHALARISVENSTNEQRVAGWGVSRHGQLGPQNGPNLPPFISSPNRLPVRDVTSLALGNQHSVFLQSSGVAIGLGSDRKHQLHEISSLSAVQSIGATWNGSYLIRQENDSWFIYGTGSNSNGQLGCSPTETTTPSLSKIPFPDETRQNYEIVDMACGSEHVLVLLKEKINSTAQQPSTAVWAWGWNEHGNLGLGHTDDVTSPTRVWPPANTPRGSEATVVGIYAGNGTSWIVVEEG